MNAQSPIAPIGHNKPPVNPPNESDVLLDLKGRFPEVETKTAEFEDSLKGFPEKIADEETAGALSDLIKQMTSQKAAWKGQRGAEKKPWDTIAKVVMNFFSKGEDKIETLVELWKPRYQAYIDAKTAANLAAAEEEARKQREEADKKRAEAEAAEKAAAEAEERRAKALREEDEARARKEALEKQRLEDERKAEDARLEAKRIEDEKKRHDKAEREQNEESMRAVKRHMKDAERLHALAEGDEASEDEAKALDELIRPGGTIGALMAPISNSVLLDEDQKRDVFDTRARLGELRTAVNARFDKKEAKRRKKLADEADAREKATAAEREERRKADEARAAEAKRLADEAEAKAAATKAAEKAAAQEVRDKRTEGREAIADGREAEKAGKAAGALADRAENRAGRMERKIDNASEADFGRVRGDFSLGSNTGRWKYDVEDEAALRAVCGPLGEHFTAEALAGAVSRWMAAHRASFTGERVTDPTLPGAVFFWERDVAIR